MNFRTEIPLKQQNNNITYDSNVVLLGSCFTENIGNKLTYYKFDNIVNPNGILFNPVSIKNSIKEALDKKQYTKDDLIFSNNLWHSFNHHSKFSSPDGKCTAINESNSVFSNYLKKATHVIITLGTASVYRYLKTNAVVANCHKISQKEFSKHLLSITEIENCLVEMIDLIKSINNKVSIIFTVSPVRHLKDGFIENTRSKAHLISAIHQITNESNIFYFPAYEIMMDDLRDYRFYAEDMIHPNQMAINYIWDKFSMTWMYPQTIKIMKEVQSIQMNLAHKPFHPKSKKHQEFLKKLDASIKYFTKENPGISF